MKDSTINRELKRLESELLNPKNRRSVLLTLDWVKSVPEEAGVYGWFESGSLIYVGETGLLRKRMNDARTTKHHSLRRSLGNERFRRRKGFAEATTKKKFVPPIETALDSLMKTLEVCMVPVLFGRKEFEEFIVCDYDPEYNRRGKRS